MDVFGCPGETWHCITTVRQSLCSGLLWRPGKQQPQQKCLSPASCYPPQVIRFYTFCFVWKQPLVLSVCSPADLLKKPPRPAVSVESSLQYFYLYCCSSHTAVWTRPRFLQALRKSGTKGNQSAVNCDLTELEDTAPWGRISQHHSLPLSKGECPAPFEK